MEYTKIVDGKEVPLTEQEISEIELRKDKWKVKSIEDIKLEKKEAIEKIASISDQLNLTAWTLDIIVDILAVDNPEILQNPWIQQSKVKLNEIKNILNK